MCVPRQVRTTDWYHTRTSPLAETQIDACDRTDRCRASGSRKLSYLDLVALCPGCAPPCWSPGRREACGSCPPRSCWAGWPWWPSRWPWAPCCTASACCRRRCCTTTTPGEGATHLWSDKQEGMSEGFISNVWVKQMWVSDKKRQSKTNRNNIDIGCLKRSRKKR